MKKDKIILSRNKKKNNVVIIVTGEERHEIKEELLLALRKMGRKKELGFYIGTAEKDLFEMIQKFADFILKISARNR